MARKHTFPIIALICTLTAISWFNLTEQTPSQGRQCRLSDGHCSLLHENLKYSVQINPVPIPLEEELTVTLSIPTQRVFQRAWIEGVNMYMGKLPVVVEGSHTIGTHVSYDAITFLGSCSEPNMRWRMVVEVAEGNGRTERLFFNFQTEIR